MIIIDGGKGVGRVTKPGLGLEIGKPAINPTPLKMISQAIDEVLGELKHRYGVSVIISVPKGEEIAKKTDNPRLGNHWWYINFRNDWNRNSIFHSVICSFYSPEYRCFKSNGF